MLLFENISEQISIKDTFLTLFKSIIQQNNPINIVDGYTLNFGNEFLQEIF